MMYMESFTVFIFRNAAVLASMVVAYICALALFLPVGAIVRESPAFPIMHFFASAILGLPFAVASKIAEMIFACANTRWRPPKNFITPITVYLDFFESGMVFSPLILRLPLILAFMITKAILAILHGARASLQKPLAITAFNAQIVLGFPVFLTYSIAKMALLLPNSMSMARDCSCAIGTLDIYLGKARGLLPTNIARLPFAFALAIAKAMFAALKIRRGPFYLSPTIITFNYCWHDKSLLLLDGVLSRKAVQQEAQKSYYSNLKAICQTTYLDRDIIAQF